MTHTSHGADNSEEATTTVNSPTDLNQVDKTLKSITFGEFAATHQEEETMPATLTTRKYVRKPFEVEAVQVTAENMEAVAAWCKGAVKREGVEGRDDRYIAVKVHKPQDPRHGIAKAGDWILFAGRGFKVYTPRAFEKSFDVVNDSTVTIVLPSSEEADSSLVTVNVQEDNAAKNKVPSPAMLAALAKKHRSV